MLVLTKTSITCLLFIIYMAGFYYLKPHIPTKSTRVFQRLICVAVLNAFFDLITIYTVNNRDVIGEQINLFAHIIYLMSILGFIYLLFLYLRSYLEVHMKFSNKIRVLHCVPFIVSAVGILVLPITYIHGKTTDYSLGPKAYALYGSLVVYLILILYYCLRYWAILDGEKRVVIFLAVPLYVVNTVIQILLPETLLVIVCSTLILLGLILSNENMEKYLDEKTVLFNRYSFETVLDEFDFDKHSAVIAVLCFCKTGGRMDWSQDALILKDIYKEIRQYRLYGYRISENGVAMLVSSRERAQLVLGCVKDAIEDKYGKDRICIETKVLSGANAATQQNCMRNMMSFCAEMGSRLAYVDYLTNIYNRNALERDLEERAFDRHTYYVTADLNDLKIVNDTIGHSAGDKLLQGFARLLADTVGEDGKAYRQGGDEFAVLYRKDVEVFVRELKRQCMLYNQLNHIPISYAVGYCSVTDKNFRDVADQMMYEDKRRIKGGRAAIR